MQPVSDQPIDCGSARDHRLKRVPLKVAHGLADEPAFHVGIDHPCVSDDIPLRDFFEQLAGAFEVGASKGGDDDIVGEGAADAVGFDGISVD